MSQFAWVTLATNDSYSLGALVVAHSLKRVHTAHQLAVLITPGVSEAMKIKLHNVFNVVQEVNLLDSKDNANLALLKRPELGITFTKLHCWRLTQFEKCVFLDADTLVLRNCDELFEREELSAAPDVGWPDCFNSGVFVFRPSLDTFSSLMQFAVTNGSFDGGDQGLLNQYFSDWAHKDISKHLPFVYNTSSVASYSYLPAFKQFGQNTKILHFIGTAKPWLQNFNSETRKVYTPGGFQHLANFLQYWWDIFCEDVHSRLSTDMAGLAGALAQLHLGEPKSVEQEAYVEHMRRQCWESGNIDYMGRDSFDNIWRRIQQTLNGGSSAAAASAPTETAEAPAPAPAPVRTVSPAPPRFRSSKSRSRSTTPKRDPRDRSPTPQPEDTPVPVEKKEVQVAPPIQEEDDSLSATQLDESAERTKLPPPVQYDPTTSTTILTKKVFAGYQQIITTKSPEGKTRTQIKTIYDPSVDADAIAVDVVDGPVRVASATIAESRIEPIKPLEPEVQPQPEVEPERKATTPPRQEPQSPPAKASPRPQLQQQVVQESMAGKEPTVEPVKLVRRKRLVSPQVTPAPPTSQSPIKPPKQKTVSPKTTTATKTSSSAKSLPSATTKPNQKTPPSTTVTNHQTLTTSLENNNQQQTATSTVEQIDPATDELATQQQPPMVPPRRKRESKISRIGKAQN